MQPLRPATLLLLVGAGGGWFAGVATAQGAGLFRSPRLINLDTGVTLSQGHWYLSSDFRSFDEPESETHGDFEARYGLSEDWEVGLAYAFSEQRLHDTGRVLLRHGGTSLDLKARHPLKQTRRAAVAVSMGLELPNTPAQDEPHFHAGLPISWRVTSNVTAHVVPELVFLRDNTLFALGLGVEGRISDHLRLLGEWTPLLDGQNTRDRFGMLAKDNIWGAAVRLLPGDNDEVTIDLGVTNATGRAMSLSFEPGLLDSAAFYGAVNWQPRR
jgi:hypothetical protein